MARKNQAFSFITTAGRQSTRSFGSDIGMKEFEKTAKGLLNNKELLDKSHFKSAHHFLSKAELALRTVSFLGRITVGLIPNGDKSATNKENFFIPFVFQNLKQAMGKKDCIYYKNHVHVGKYESSRILRIKSGPFIETLTKSLATSSDDYQDHNFITKSKNLYLKILLLKFSKTVINNMKVSLIAC